MLNPKTVLLVIRVSTAALNAAATVLKKTPKK